MPSYDIHPDYKDLRIGDTEFNKGLMSVVNLLVRTQCFFRRKNPAVSYQRHFALAGDGAKIKLEVIRPKSTTSKRCLVHYSGGAFCVGPQPSHYEKAELYAINANCTVVFVTYRLSPWHIFPVGLNDCYSALEWTIDHAEQLKIDVNNIIVGGDSAGGFMAAAVPQMAVDRLNRESDFRLKGQMLIYPVTDSTCSTFSATEFNAVPVFSGNANRSMWQTYLKGLDRNQLPEYASPLNRKNFTGLPPAYVETAEFDPLRDEGIAYGEKLKAAGVETHIENTKTTVHGFDIYAKNALYVAAMKTRYHFLNKIFTS